MCMQTAMIERNRSHTHKRQTSRTSTDKQRGRRGGSGNDSYATRRSAETFIVLEPVAANVNANLHDKLRLESHTIIKVRKAREDKNEVDQECNPTFRGRQAED